MGAAWLAARSDRRVIGVDREAVHLVTPDIGAAEL
jgi:hypothetical protein